MIFLKTFLEIPLNIFGEFDIFYTSFLSFLHKFKKIYPERIDLKLFLGYNVMCICVYHLRRRIYFGRKTGRCTFNEKTTPLRLEPNVRYSLRYGL